MVDENEIDDGFLADVTAFLGGLGGDELPNLVGSGDDILVPPANLHELQRLKAVKRRKKYRDKLKSERQSLAQQEKDLTTRLRQLKAERKKKPQDTTLLGAWRAIASRQLEKRCEVEQQQRELRAAVVYRARLIHQMKTMLQEPSVSINTKVTLSKSKFEGTALLDKLLEQLDPLYAQTDEIYRGLKFKASTAIDYNPKRKMDGDIEYFESTDATAIPFDFETAVSAMSAVLLSDWDGARYEEAPNPENTTAAKYNIKYRRESGEIVPFWAYAATRRYKEANRVVFVWRLVIEGQNTFAGLHTDENGWVVVRPSVEITRSDASQTQWTVGETYTRLVPSSPGNEQSDQFTKIVLKSGEQEVKEMTRMLDRILLNSSQAVVTGMQSDVRR